MAEKQKSEVRGQKTDQSELSLGLPGMLAHKKFPGRTSLMVPEVAAVLEIDEKQVISLILEGLLGAVEITGRGNKSSREHWRIPVECYDDYIRRRSNTTEGRR
jgi:hypothetical protein